MGGGEVGVGAGAFTQDIYNTQLHVVKVVWSRSFFHPSIHLSRHPSIHLSRHPSMDGIIQGRKPWQK